MQSCSLPYAVLPNLLLLSSHSLEWISLQKYYIISCYFCISPKIYNIQKHFTQNILTSITPESLLSCYYMSWKSGTKGAHTLCNALSLVQFYSQRQCETKLKQNKSHINQTVGSVKARSSNTGSATYKVNFFTSSCDRHHYTLT